MRGAVLKRRVVGAAAALVVLYLFFWPVAIDPIAWEAPTPVTFTPTGSLADVERVTIADANGPEDIDVDEEGRVYAGLADGRILRWPGREGGAPEVFADTKGRPLGLHWDREGRLLVADATRGLLRIDRLGVIEVLATACGGRPLVFTDDLEVTADGTVWFTDASVVFTQVDWRADILESRPHGRLCAYDPATRQTREVIGALHFANGVAIDPAQQFVLVNETSRYRVRRLWIAGPKKGTVDTLIENLPGFPDGISTGEGGRFWIAIASPRSGVVDGTSGLPWLRRLMWRLPEFVQPKPQKTARIIAVDADGKVLHDLFDPSGSKIHVVTSVQERAGHLYLGSLVDDAWAHRPAP